MWPNILYEVRYKHHCLDRKKNSLTFVDYVFIGIYQRHTKLPENSKCDLLNQSYPRSWESILSVTSRNEKFQTIRKKFQTICERIFSFFFFVSDSRLTLIKDETIWVSHLLHARHFQMVPDSWVRVFTISSQKKTHRTVAMLYADGYSAASGSSPFSCLVEIDMMIFLPDNSKGQHLQAWILAEEGWNVQSFSCN